MRAIAFIHVHHKGGAACGACCVCLCLMQFVLVLRCSERGPAREVFVSSTVRFHRVQVFLEIHVSILDDSCDRHAVNPTLYAKGSIREEKLTTTPTFQFEFWCQLEISVTFFFHRITRIRI